MNVSACRSTATLLLLCSSMVMEVFSYEATIRWNDLRQNIDGFGACAGHGARKWSYTMTDATKQAMIDVLFDTTNGAGLSIIRAEVPYTLSGSGGSGAFGTNDDGQAEFMKEALKRNPSILLWSAPWSPPPEWKTNNATRGGGSLLPGRYQDYANYLSTYARECKTYLGKDMYAISVQNEPHFAAPWEACVYSPTEIRDFVKNNLGPTFVNDGVVPTIMIPESNWDERSWADVTLNDPDAAKYCGVVGLHFYHDSKLATPYPEVKAAGKQLWETEASWAGNNGPAMVGANFWFKKRHNTLTQAEANAWHYWWFWDVTRQEGLLTGAPGNTGSGPDNHYTETKRMWTLGNYSRFIKYGWRMMGMPQYYSSDSTLMVSGYRDETSGRFAIIAANFNNMDRSAPVNIHLDGATATQVTPWLTDETRNLSRQADIPVEGGCFHADLPANTVVTYMGTGTALSPSAAEVNSFTYEKERIIPGESNTLSWTTTGATSVSIDNGIGAVAASGSAAISPSATTTYTLTVQGAGGPTIRKVTVIVLPAYDPVNPPGLSNGLDWAYYETQNGSYDDFSGQTPTSSGSYATFSHSPATRNTDFSFHIRGYVEVPTDGVYTFIPRGYGTMMLHVDGVRLLNQDYDEVGFGGLIDFLSGSIGLKAGKHSIALGTHFAFGASDPWLEVGWEGPGIDRQKIPAANLFHNGEAVSLVPVKRKAQFDLRRTAPVLYNMRGQRIARGVARGLNTTQSTGVFIREVEDKRGRAVRCKVIAR